MATPADDQTRPSRSTRARPTDDDLLDGALEVFAEHGAATTMSAVAEHCNTTKPTLYAHFGDKDALRLRVLQREADTCRATLFTAYAASADLDLAEQVEADTRALFDYADAHPGGFALLFGGNPAPGAAEIRDQLAREVEDQLAQRVHDYLRERGATSVDHPSGIEKQFASMLVGVAVSAARHAVTRGVPHDRACAVAAAFSVAALSNLDPTGCPPPMNRLRVAVGPGSEPAIDPGEI